MRRPAAAIGLLLGASLVAGPPGASGADPDAGRRDAEGAKGTSRPDIIVVMVDDLGYIEDDRVLRRLPNIRALWLEGGLRFRHMYDETPLCCPSRATFLTGRHTLSHGVVTNDGDDFDPRDTLAVRLSRAGYHTFLAGKYLNKYEGTRRPPGWDHVAMSEASTRARFTIDGRRRTYPGRPHDDAVRRIAVTWLRRAPAREPVFALVTPRAPHHDLGTCRRGTIWCRYLPEAMRRDQGARRCAGIPDLRPPGYRLNGRRKADRWAMPNWRRGWPMRAVCESMLVVDRMVGKLVEVQRARGRPAWFVFLSDNGMAWGRKGFPFKHVPSATRMPFYLAGPGVPVGDRDALATNLDIAPTLAEIAGLPFPALGGRSLIPHVADPDAPGHDLLLEVMPSHGAHIYPGWAAMRTASWRYIRWEGGTRELYLLGRDPWELDDLAPRLPHVTAALDAQLDALLLASHGPRSTQEVVADRRRAP